jgi:hypothetical protein
MGRSDRDLRVRRRHRVAAGIALASGLSMSGLSTAAGCGDTGSGTGGAASSTSIATAASTTGAGMQFPGCDTCMGSTPICLDGMACASQCPSGRTSCVTQNDPTAEIVCCASGEQCCPGLSADYCAPGGGPCPNVCPDGSTCPSSEHCQLDPELGAYGCVDQCDVEQQCGGISCPLGAQCTGTDCRLPDLSIDVPYLTSSVEISQRTFDANACEIGEGCVAAPGQRTLLRFSLRTPNTGAGDLFLGSPIGNPLFQYSACHDHYHFTGYADYELIDQNGQAVAFGHKQAFCLLDFDPLSPDSPPGMYTCDFQGIQAGWSDIYESSLPCQWVDITDLPAGDYQLKITLNGMHTLAESDYSNDVATVPVTIPPNACPQGCGVSDATCCAAGDPCGKANDGACDCGGQFGWDVADCDNCYGCQLTTTCPGGCTPASDPCCEPGDPCGWADNGVCDCEQTEPWDDGDCTSCVSDDPECANVNTCPNGCTTAASQSCCVSGDPCGYAGDGWCDCGGQQPWDASDCSHCTTNDPACP